jgi:hypothetical protein
MTEALALVFALPSATEAKIGSSVPSTPDDQVSPPFLGCVPPTIFVPK